MLKIIKELRERYKTAECYDELIHLFISVTYKSSLAYLFATIIYVWFLYEYIPSSLLIPWAFLQILYPVLRQFTAKYYKGMDLTIELKKRFLSQHILMTLSAGLMWGTGSILCAIYAPSPYEYMVLTLIVGLSSGSLTTLSPLYPTYLAFNLPALLLLMVSFLIYHDSLHYAISFMIMIYTIIVPSATWDVNKNVKRLVELNKLYSQAQSELKEINLSLEEKVAKEVAVNRHKDKQMLAQSRLAQMGEMLSMIAHQWRQPLSAISATTGSISIKMQLGDYDEAFIEKSLQSINTYTQYLSTTINDFRNFFKPNKDKSSTSLNDITLGALHIIGSSLESNGIVVETYLDTKVMFQSYPNELQQVLLNLLKNAQDVMIEKRVEAPKIIIKTQNAEDELSLMICDNAGGILDENMPYIFDPYFTTKEKLDGTGLGLYMSKLIIEEHCRGRLRVKNEDKGACFSFTLPLD